jgi:D-glycero-D-manno-heptose 1,7-bisphosphate phosphatase
MRRAVFLDRDGVLVEAIVRDGRAYAATSLAEFRIEAAAREQVERLERAGFARIVFTNQPEIGRGLLSWDALDAMHARLRAAMPLDDILVCPHSQDGACTCRKPLPGMLLEAAARWSVNLADSVVIGDRWRDIEAGRAAGCFTILLARSYSDCETADMVVDDLASAVDAVVSRTVATPQPSVD